jgi:hypothetical protein
LPDDRLRAVAAGTLTQAAVKAVAKKAKKAVARRIPEPVKKAAKMSKAAKAPKRNERFLDDPRGC